MVKLLRRVHSKPLTTKILVVSAALLLSLGFYYAVKPQPTIDTTKLPSTSKVLNARTDHRTLKVEGYGTQVPENAGGALQNARPLDRSGEVGDHLQNPEDTSTVQPNSGQSTFNNQAQP